MVAAVGTRTPGVINNNDSGGVGLVELARSVGFERFADSQSCGCSRDEKKKIREKKNKGIIDVRVGTVGIRAENERWEPIRRKVYFISRGSCPGVV